MKTPVFFSVLFSVALFGLTAGCMTTAEHAAARAAQPKVRVEFIDPENFKDVKDGFVPTAKGQAANIEEVRRYLVEAGERYVPEGHTLNIAVTDIDLAGDYEFWGRAGTENIRLIKGIYPPRLELNFSLTDAGGAVVLEGERILHDMAFQMRVDIRQNDPLRYEKSLIDDWLRADFRGLASSKD